LVSACRDDDASASSLARGAGSASAGCATRSRARCPSKAAGSTEIAKGVGSCPQVGNRLWTTMVSPVPGGVRPISGAWGSAPMPDRQYARLRPRRRRRPAHRWKAPRASPDPALLRGRAGEAALAPAASAQATPRGPRAPALRGGGARGVRSSRRCSRTRAAPRDVGVSSRRRSGLMTRGARADRVGVKLSPGRPQGRSGAPPGRLQGRSGARGAGCASRPAPDP